MTDSTIQAANVVTADQVQKTPRKRRVLDAAGQKKVKEFVARLTPENPAKPPKYIDLVGNALIQLSEAVSESLTQVSVEDLKKIRTASSLIMKRIKSVDISRLSPEARTKLLFLKETVEDIMARISALFDDYRSANGEIQKASAEVVKMRDDYIQMSNATGVIGEETDKSVDLIFAAVEACRLFLEKTGDPKLAELNAAVENDRVAAEAEGRYQDNKLIKAAQSYAEYLDKVNRYMAMLDGAGLDADQTVEGLKMQENNLSIIAQTLDDIVKITVPAWKRLIWLAWTAFQSKGAATFVQEQYAATNDLRKQAAQFVKVAAEAMAQLVTTSAYDYDTLEMVNAELISALGVLATAAEQAEKMYEINSARGEKMVVALNTAKSEFSDRK